LTGLILRGCVVLGFAFSVSERLFDVNVPAGLVFHHENSPTPRKHLIETMGGGVALLDYNNDGLLDSRCSTTTTTDCSIYFLSIAAGSTGIPLAAPIPVIGIGCTDRRRTAVLSM